MEKIPPANYTPEQKRANEQFEERARARNATRSLGDKILRRKKVSGADVLHETADRVNELVDAGRAEASAYGLAPNSFQESADKILEGSEFNMTPEMSEFEEGLRVKYPILLESINQVAITSALDMILEIGAQMAPVEAESFVRNSRSLLNMRVESVVRAADITKMRTILELNSSRALAEAGLASQIARMPQDLLANRIYGLKLRSVMFYAREEGSRDPEVLGLLDRLSG
jgi:hypothetical protein